METLTRRDRFLNACRLRPVDRVPIWFMRQAGRYLPGYREWRQQMAFSKMLKQPEVAAEVSLEPLNVLDIDAVILFSDILVLPEAMGLSLQFPDSGPRFPSPIRDRQGIEALRLPVPERDLAGVLDTIRIIREKAGADVPVIGFAGAPFTLGLFVVEGKVSRQFEVARCLYYERPRHFHRLLERLAEALIPFLVAQAAAGADALQLFDSYAGLLSPAEYRSAVLPVLQKVIAGVRENTAVPILYYANECHSLVEAMAESGADVLGVDWRTDLAETRQRTGRPVCLQGNLDPACLFGTAQQVEERVGSVLDRGGGLGHIFNVGHGLLPDTPVEQLQNLVRFIQNPVVQGNH